MLAAMFVAVVQAAMGKGITDAVQATGEEALALEGPARRVKKESIKTYNKVGDASPVEEPHVQQSPVVFEILCRAGLRATRHTKGLERATPPA